MDEPSPISGTTTPRGPARDSFEELVGLFGLTFPDPRRADPYGLVAIGGDFRPARLLAAYGRGIFPWPSEEMPRAWFSPDPRMVLRPGELHVSKSLAKTLRRGRFEVRWDSAFDAVIRRCSESLRPGQHGTWINEDIIAGFCALHRLGFAHSVETWEGESLVGGLYGISLGSMFCGESMFHERPDASKVAFAALDQRLVGWGFRLIDCQIPTDHLASLGARPWSRDLFLDELALALQSPTHRGSWNPED